MIVELIGCWLGCWLGYEMGESISNVLSDKKYEKYKKEMLKKLSNYLNKEVIIFVDMRIKTNEDEIRYRIKNEDNYRILDTKIFDNL